MKCIADHALIKSTPSLWAKCTPIGVILDPDSSLYDCELANCSCNSTLCRYVNRGVEADQHRAALEQADIELRKAVSA